MCAVDLLMEVLNVRDGLLQLLVVAGLEIYQGQVHSHAGDAAPRVALLLQHVKPAPQQASPHHQKLVNVFLTQYAFPACTGRKKTATLGMTPLI